MTDPREELKRLVDEFAANCCLYDKAAVAGADSTELDLRGAVRDNSESALHAAIDALFAQPVIRFKPLPEDIAEITARRLPSMLEVVQPADAQDAAPLLSLLRDARRELRTFGRPGHDSSLDRIIERIDAAIAAKD